MTGWDYLKRRTDAALINAIHPGTLPDPDADLDLGGHVNFDGGVRELGPQPPRIVWTRDPDDRAWWTATFIDRQW